MGRACTLLPVRRPWRYSSLGQASSCCLILEDLQTECLGWDWFFYVLFGPLHYCVGGFCVVLICFVFNGEPGFSPVKTKRICMYFQRSITSSLTRSLQGFALECTEHFQHCRYQWEGDASPPPLLSRSGCKNKHIMALQALTDAMISIGLSRATAMCQDPRRVLLAWGATQKGEGKGANGRFGQMFLCFGTLLAFQSPAQKINDQFLCKSFFATILFFPP